MEIYIAGIVYGSMVDGDGLRTSIFFSGCNVGCNGCQNKDFWNMKNGKLFTVKTLIDEIYNKTPQKKVTISGGEPLEQKEALILLINELKKKDFDIGLYTSYQLEEIDNNIIKNLTFIKTGKFDINKKIYGKFYGSSNQSINFINKKVKYESM